MAKKLGKTLLGLACIGAVAGAAYAYFKSVAKDEEELFEEDFDDISEDCDCDGRTYTTIPNGTDDEAETDDTDAEETVDETTEEAATETEEVSESEETPEE